MDHHIIFWIITFATNHYHTQHCDFITQFFQLFRRQIFSKRLWLCYVQFGTSKNVRELRLNFVNTFPKINMAGQNGIQYLKIKVKKQHLLDHFFKMFDCMVFRWKIRFCLTIKWCHNTHYTCSYNAKMKCDSSSLHWPFNSVLAVRQNLYYFVACFSHLSLS